MLENAKNDLLELRGKEVRIFGQKTILDYKTDLVDAIDIIENLKELECNEFISNRVLEKFDSDLENDLQVGNGDNTYNYNANVSNDINWYFVSEYNEINEERKKYVIVKFHRYGDVRGNYTEESVLRISDDIEFYEHIGECDKNYKITVDNHEWYVGLSALSSDITLDNDSNEYIYDCYCVDDIEEKIREYYKD